MKSILIHAESWTAKVEDRDSVKESMRARFLSLQITWSCSSLWARMVLRASAGSWSTALLLKSPALWERMKAEQIDPSMVEGRTSASNHTRIALEL